MVNLLHLSAIGNIKDHLLFSWLKFGGYFVLIWGLDVEVQVIPEIQAAIQNRFQTSIFHYCEMFFIRL